MKPEVNPGIRRRYSSRLKPSRGFPTAMAWVDLFFLLLLFIIMASSVVKISGVKIDLPQATPSAEVYPGMVQYIVTLTAGTPDDPDGKIVYQDKEYSIEELRAQFNQISNPGEQTIVIRADKDVPFERVNEVVFAAKEEGIKKAVFAVEVPDKKPEMYFE